MRILGVSGSLQARSGNLSLLQSAARLAPPGVEVVIFSGLRELPPFDPDLESAGPPPPVREWQRALANADALLIASPEYGHSLPGSLKNAIDWVIGSGELHLKVVGVTASTSGPGRGELGLGALLQTLGAVSAVIVGGEPIVRDDEAERRVAALVAQVVATVEESARGVD